VAAWNGRRDIFQTQATARAVELRRQFVKLKEKRQEPITEYLSRVRVLRDDIIMAGGNLQPEDVVTTVLAGLPKSYAMAVSLITDKTLKDLKLVQTKLTTVGLATLLLLRMMPPDSLRFASRKLKLK
jgi:hypothetical protein